MNISQARPKHEGCGWVPLHNVSRTLSGDDLRTPPSEAKQLYHGLKLRKIPTVLVEIPDATHSIANRPSNLMTKIAHTIAWFNKYKKIE